MNNFHGHTVLEWIAAEPTGRSIEEIIKWSQAEHSALATYRTCKLQGLDIQQLIEFFLEAGKVEATEGRLTFNPARAC